MLGDLGEKLTIPIKYILQKLEQHVQTLSEAREEDKNHTQKLKSELENCFQEIGITPRYSCYSICD